MSAQWYNKNKLEAIIKAEIIPTESVLDIGCGISPQTFIEPLKHICCDPCSEYIDTLKIRLKNKRRVEYVFLNDKWSEVVKKFSNDSVDSVFLLDVIEHLEKKEGLKLLKKTESIARKQIVIFTTLGYIKQIHKDGRDAWGLSGGKWQEHKSGWWPSDFDKSWKVFACRFFHPCDNLGRRYLIHKGAFYAIKNFY